MDNPEAPLPHHRLDSTHITFGVVTGGYVWRNFKVEASAFNGREPDQNRWNIDLLTVAQMSGTSVVMIEKHYGHLRGCVAAAALAKLVLWG